MNKQLTRGGPTFGIWPATWIISCKAKVASEGGNNAECSINVSCYSIIKDGNPVFFILPENKLVILLYNGNLDFISHPQTL